jgi:hypothetical protein
MMTEMSYGLNLITYSFSSPARRNNLLCVTKAVVSVRASMLLIYTFFIPCCAQTCNGGYSLHCRFTSNDDATPGSIDTKFPKPNRIK